MPDDALAHYAAPGRFTAVAIDDAIAGDAADIVRAVQGLLIYDLAADPLYGVTLAPDRADAIHERDSASLLRQARAIDPRPFDVARAPADRLGARCHAYTRLTVAFLRAVGVPARARCGFGAYFEPGMLEDHWIAEVWDASAGRWRMVDAQLDDVWRSVIELEGDPLDLGPDEFVTAGHAWQAWRSGTLDADRCGLTSADEHGAHWIAGNLRLDLAALNKVEMLPWDVWGAGWEPGTEPPEEMLARFDEVARLTTDPDANLSELRSRYEQDDSLRMDGTVFNVLRGALETVAAG